MADEELGMEEERIGTEVQKVLGRIEGDSIKAHPVSVSAQISTREMRSSQTELVAVEFARRMPIEQIGEAFRDFSSTPQALQLPSAPAKPIVFHEEGRRFDSGLNSAAGGHCMREGTRGAAAAVPGARLQVQRSWKQRHARRCDHIDLQRRTDGRASALRARCDLNDKRKGCFPGIRPAPGNVY